MNFYEAWQAMLAGKKVAIKNHGSEPVLSLTHDMAEFICPITGKPQRLKIMHKIWCHMPISEVLPVKEFTANDIARFMEMDWGIVE